MTLFCQQYLSCSAQQLKEFSYCKKGNLPISNIFAGGDTCDNSEKLKYKLQDNGRSFASSRLWVQKIQKVLSGSQFGEVT